MRRALASGAALKAVLGPDEDDLRVAEASYETTSVYGFGHPLYYDNVIATLRGELFGRLEG